MNHQDFVPIVLNKKSKTKHTAKRKIKTPVIKINPDTEEMPKLPVISKELAHSIKMARNAKGLSQKELAVKINENLNVVSDYESGKGIINRKILRKIKKVLEMNN